MPTPGDDQIRAAYAVFNERGELDFGLFHADVEWHNDPEWPGAGVHRGVEAVRREFGRQREAWGEVRLEPVAILRSGDRVVVFVDMTVTGKSSGAPVGVEGAHVFTLREGKVVRVEAFTARDRALRAAGIAR